MAGAASPSENCVLAREGGLIHNRDSSLFKMSYLLTIPISVVDFPSSEIVKSGPPESPLQLSLPPCKNFFLMSANQSC